MLSDFLFLNAKNTLEAAPAFLEDNAQVRKAFPLPHLHLSLWLRPSAHSWLRAAESPGCWTRTGAQKLPGDVNLRGKCRHVFPSEKSYHFRTKHKVKPDLNLLRGGEGAVILQTPHNILFQK